MTTAILIIELALAVAWWLTRRRSAAIRSLGSSVRERAAARFLARRIAPYTWVASSWERKLARYVAIAAASVVQTEGFRHLVLVAICPLRSRRGIKRRRPMTLTPSTKGAFFAGIGLWLMLWLAFFKVDEVFGETLLGRFITTERCTKWIAQHRSTTLLGTELCNYSVHGIAQPDGVVFALGGTLVNTLMILCALPLRGLLKRRI